MSSSDSSSLDPFVDAEASHWSVAQLAYLAGIVDGEGHISVTQVMLPRGGSPALIAKLEVGQMDQRLILWLRDTFGGWISERQKVYRHDRWKIFYRWSLSLKKRRNLAEAMLPYLVVKRDEMALTLEAVELRRKPTGRRGVDVSVLAETDAIIKKILEVRRARSQR